MKSNPYAENSGIQPHLTEDDGFWGISQTVMALTYEQRTANLLTFYNTPSLYESLDDADRYAIQKELLHRLGVRDDA